MTKPAPRRSQEARSHATIEALLRAARLLFGESSYEAVSLDDVATEAGVTKGALYHHFPGGKPALFEAVFTQLQNEMMQALGRAALGATGSAGLRRVLNAYLNAADRPGMHRITMVDAPAVLGPEKWRESESRHALRFIIESVDTVLAEPRFSRAFKSTLAGAFYGAMYEATFIVMNASDRSAAKQRAIDATAAIIEGAYTVLLRPK